MNSKLHISNKIKNRISELSDSDNGPFYIYDVEQILKNCCDFINIPYSPKSIHFAMMANSTEKFIKIVKQEGLNIFVNSIMHLDIAKKIGYTDEEIVFAASAMDDSIMQKVVKRGAIVILDSIGQFNRWCSQFPGSGVGIRCNIGDAVEPKKTIAGYFIGSKSRLGLTIDEIQQLKGNRSVKGLHIYVGTNIIDVNYFLECYSQIIKLVELFPEICYVDFGGGFGITEKSLKIFDVVTYGQKVSELMEIVSKKSGRRIRLLIEPGRIIGGEAGFFVCKVVDIKERNNHQLIGVNASSVQFPRPLFYPDDAYHPVAIISKNNSADNNYTIDSSVYGCSTYSRDFLAQSIKLPPISIGDTVVLGNAGSYCATAHTNFLGFPEAKEYFI